MSIEIIDGKVKALGKTHGIGDVLTLDIEEEKRLVELGFAKYIEEPVYNDETIKTSLTVEDLQDMDYADIKQIAKDMGLDTTGKKVDLIERIVSTKVEIADDDKKDDAIGSLEETNPETSYPEV